MDPQLENTKKKNLDAIDFSAHSACQEGWITCSDKTKEINPNLDFHIYVSNSKRHQAN